MYDLALVAAVTYLGPALVRRYRARKASSKTDPAQQVSSPPSTPSALKCLALGHKSAGRVMGTAQEKRRMGTRDFLVEEHTCGSCRVRFEVHIALPSEDEVKAAKRILAQREFAVAQLEEKCESSPPEKSGTVITAELVEHLSSNNGRGET